MDAFSLSHIFADIRHQISSATPGKGFQYEDFPAICLAPFLAAGTAHSPSESPVLPSRCPDDEMPPKPTTFELFPRLPPEIQNLIWDFAAAAHPDPTDQPGAHFFSIYKAGIDNVLVDGNLVDPSLTRPYRLGLPLTTVNPRAARMSAYLIDAGLRLGCHDSARALKGCHKSLMRWLERQESEISTSPESEEYHEEREVTWGTRIVFKRHSTHVGLWCWMCPLSDLIVFQPVDFNSIDLGGLGSFLRSIFNLPRWMRTLRCRNIAFELHPTWIQDGRTGNEGAFRLLQHAARWRGASWADNIWLIDYGIKHIVGAPLRKDRRLFVGNRCRFIEVLLKDAQWEFSTVVDSYNFVRRLAIPNLEWPHRLRHTQEPFYSQRIWGVLACLMDDDE